MRVVRAAPTALVVPVTKGNAGETAAARRISRLLVMQPRLPRRDAPPALAVPGAPEFAIGGERRASNDVLSSGADSCVRECWQAE
jgi:hypothetical protein